jgi:hypothetical protein
MRVRLSGPRHVRPGVDFSLAELRRVAIAPLNEPDWLDRLLSRAVKLSVVIVAGAFIYLVGAMVFGMVFFGAVTLPANCH